MHYLDVIRFYPVSLATRKALKKDLDLDGGIILALGRIADNKGYDLLTRPMTTVFQRVKDVRLLVAIGSTEPNESEVRQVDALKRLARGLDISDRVIFRDYIPDAWLADHYRAAREPDIPP